ncbi:MAG TPA: LiaF domain-containing protein [Gemmatimonadaceae bacterium]
MREPEGRLSVPIRHRVVHRSAESADLPAKQGIVAFVSSQERTGPWRLSPETRVVSIFGSAELDLREADLVDGESVIEIFCLLGNVEIVVPPGVRVVNEGDGLAANFAVEAGDRDLDPGAPVLRITGSAYLGNVEVRHQAFGETPRQARRRRKRLRKG